MTKPKLLVLKGKETKTRWVYCPKCRGESAYNIDINPPSCIRCGFVFEVKNKRERKKDG